MRKLLQKYNEIRRGGRTARRVLKAEAPRLRQRKERHCDLGGERPLLMLDGIKSSHIILPKSKMRIS